MAKLGNFKRSIYAAKAKGPFEKAKLKATYEGDFDPPKEKHVQTILWTLQGQNMQTTPEAAFGSLTQRLISTHWATVMKALIIVHRGIDQVGPGYAGRVADLSLPLANFNDPSERGSAHNKLIQEYYAYVKSKAHNHSRRNSSLLAPQTERTRFFERLDGNELIREIGYLNNQLANLVKLGPIADLAIRNYQLKVTQNLVGFVLKDGAPLYRTLDIGISVLIDKFSDLDPASFELALDHYKKFEQHSSTLKKFYELGSRLQAIVGVSPPKFTHRSKEVLQSLQMFASETNPEIAAEANEIQMSKEEIEMQKTMLAQFEEAKRLAEEQKKNEDLVGEVVEQPKPEPPPAARAEPVQQAPPQPPSAADIVMGMYNQPGPANPAANPGAAQPGMPPSMTPQQMQMMQQYMTMMAASGANPMMTNPMMMGNPMMTNPAMMSNPMMTNPAMMGNPMMTNPAMSAAPQPQIKVNLDPTSQAVGQIPDPNQRRPQQPVLGGFNPNPPPPAPGANPFGGSAPAASSDPFANLSQPQVSGPPHQYDPFGNPAVNPPKPSQPQGNDPFSDLF